MFQVQPNREEFVAAAKLSQSIPVYCSILSDHLTPVSAFDRLGPTSEYAFLLESVIGGEKIARYSFLGAGPIQRVEASERGGRVIDRGGMATSFEGDPLESLEKVLHQHRAAPLRGLPRFVGGAVGYAGYDLVRRYEPLGTPPPDDRGLPILQFGIYDSMVVFDHVRKLIHVVAHGHPGNGVSAESAYEKACARIVEITDQLTEVRPDPARPFFTHPPTSVSCKSNVTPKAFEESVDRCKEYIRAGDIFQVVLAQRFSATTDVDPFDVYRSLRVINPSPFMFYLQSPAVTLVGASPEILCRIEDRTVSTRPLAGTRPRGRTDAEDMGLEAELLADPKERAEHVMLVDLGRNDLARVCTPGTVKVDDLMSIERYSHVMHICSNVSGTLADGKSSFDALRSVLPVGTVSGAPKVRAMQIIDELEPVRRGPYAGAVGYFDFAGNMDTCIALRTLVITPSPDGKCLVDAQVGAGIVADSEPTREYQETVNKAQAMFSALDLAHAWKRAGA